MKVVFVVFLLLASFLAGVSLPVKVSAAATGEGKGDVAADAKSPQPKSLTVDRIDEFMAGLSDEQVRRILIDTLRTEAEKAAAAAATHPPSGLAGFVENLRNLANRIQERIDFLRSGGEQRPVKISEFYTFMGAGEKGRGVWHAIWTTAAVFAAAGIVSGLLQLYRRRARNRVDAKSPSRRRAKLGKLLTEAFTEFLQLSAFVLVTLTIFHIFLDRSTGQRLLMATYLAAFIVVLVMRLILRFLLAPSRPHLCLLPLTDSTARYLYHWLMAVTVVTTFGLLTCGVFRLAGASGAEHFAAVTLVATAIAAILIAMILGRRREFAHFVGRNLPESSLRARLAARWHYFAVAGVILLLASSSINRLLGYGSQGPGVKTLLLIGLYFLFDWLLKQVLQVAFDLVKRPAAATKVFRSAGAFAAGEVGEKAPAIANQTELPPSEKSSGSHVNVDRIKVVIRKGLRTLLAVLTAFWVLRLWGVEFTVGRTMAQAVFNILVVILIGYGLWEVTSAAIQRRLQREMSEDEEELEEGGAGGSRVATLLLLLRKFLLAVIVVIAALITLSSIGVDIGPLIAGAGVVGLAIGFGAQNLVKDIIAGMFFMIDDAFRVGDYIKASGTKGMVEHISLRSLRLRHPRGMVNTISFGDMGIVTNYSRDYIITKLDFRVRYDADVDKIRKIIKKQVYQKILDNEELAPKLLGKIKSQGVREMDDSAMIMRVKYKTIPGEQFAIRKEVYRLMQEAFRKEGIEFAHRNVTVYLPPEVVQGSEADNKSPQEALMGAAGAIDGAAVGKKEIEQ
jgi:small-conductance mechanosensitive channel